MSKVVRACREGRTTDLVEPLLSLLLLVDDQRIHVIVQIEQHAQLAPAPIKRDRATVVRLCMWTAEPPHLYFSTLAGVDRSALTKSQTANVISQRRYIRDDKTGAQRTNFEHGRAVADNKLRVTQRNDLLQQPEWTARRASTRIRAGPQQDERRIQQARSVLVVVSKQR
jgi:hypothetical protein